MSADQHSTNNKESTKMAGAGLLVAITASLCCFTPVLALISGFGSVSASFSWMEPFRPFLIGLTATILGFAWFQKIKPRSQEEIDCNCVDNGKEPFIQSKRFLGIVTIFAAVMLVFPNYAHVFYPEVSTATVTNEPSITQLNLQIEGMTCTGCEKHIEHAASGVDGVTYIDVSYEEAKATIQFDQNLTTEQAVVDAVNATGYKIIETEISKPVPI